MSSLTTAGSMSASMEERSVSAVEELELGTHLSLGIAGGGAGSSRSSRPPPRTVPLFGEVLLLPDDDDGRAPPASRGKRDRGGSGAAAARQNKKARKFQATEDDGDHRSLIAGDGGGGRKKLRLTAAQAAMLEDSFRAHNILSQAEKHELARRVGLSARQVEVWFQNRRARTKLKQTEIDCELLRRWCDRLADENALLRRDLAELRASASASARLAVCAACCGKHKQVATAAEIA